MIKHFLGIVLAAATLFAGSARADVTVSAAISLKPALEKVQQELEKAAGEKISFNFGASGTLATQIQQGAPVDLFISADRATVQKLLDAKAVDAGSDKTIAGNALVLIFSPLSSDAKPAGFGDAGKLRKLAIGDPKVVPAGTYARQVLTNLKLFDDLDKGGKLVTAENVAQVLAFVQRGDADGGIVYATDAKNAGAGVQVVATADPKLHAPIEYVSAIVAKTAHHDAALKVQQALAGDKVQSVLHDFGFTDAPAAPAPPATATTAAKP